VTKLTKPISRETIQQYRHYGKTIIVTLFADFVSLAAQRHQKRKSLSVADSSPHGRTVQTRSTTGYDREAEEPENVGSA
jgi:hypothetical protein